MKNKILLILLFSFSILPAFASNDTHGESEELNVRELILDHIGDGYGWHITTFGHEHVSIPLPIIVKGQESGWHLFSSSKLGHGHEYKGFSIASEEPYKGKIIEKIPAANEEGYEVVRPWDFSITKNAASLLLSSLVLVCLILYCTRWYKKREGQAETASPKGFIAFVEMVIMSVVDDIIKPCVGKNYKRFVPYLLTVFFFIIFNNLLGLIPIFPGGANVTGNIAVTSVLAVCTLIIVNVFGSREYWKEILWPDVPTWLKVPIPIMPAIELVGVFTKPFALMIRLFANILAGHSIVLGLVCMVFLTVRLGAAMNTGMSILAVVMVVFISCVELLVAYIQAYVFTMLSAVFIGLAQVEPHHSHKKEEIIKH